MILVYLVHKQIATRPSVHIDQKVVIYPGQVIVHLSNAI